MIKTQVLVKRKLGMSRETFNDYWLETHIPIVRDIPGIQRQTISIIREDRQRADPAWDGLANAWWESEAALRAASDHPAFKAMIEDEHVFVDVSLRKPLFVEEINPVAPKLPPVPSDDVIKIVNVLHMREDLTYQAFSDYWKGPHAELNNAMPHMNAYIQNHIHPNYQDAPRACDGIAESWFNSWDEIIELSQSDAFTALKEDEPNLIVPGDLVPMICREIETINRG